MTEREARGEVLGRIRAALADRPDPLRIPRDYRLSRPTADLVALAAERITDYRASVQRVTIEELSEYITATLRQRAVRTMTCPADLPVQWRVSGVTWLPDTVEHHLSVDDLDRVDGVLTGCTLAIAETGTIVLDGGPTQGRRALSLLPDYHLCVLRSTQIVASVPEAIARLDPTRPLTFISGPSATSDIEFNRVEGVHGPRTLDVLIIE